MALIKCAECDNVVSDKAFSCPKCGAPIQPNKAFESQTKSDDNGKYTPEIKTKKSHWRIIIPLVVLFLVLILFAMVKNNPGSIPGIKLEINTPKPVVITSRADNSNSGLLKLRTTVYATIQNFGGDGNVLVTFHVYQNGNDYDRTKSIYMRSNQSSDLDVTFDEVRILDGQITYHVDAIAQ